VEKVERRCYKTFDPAAFSTDLQETELAELAYRPTNEINVNVDQLFDLYDTTMTELFDRHAPLKIGTVRKKPIALGSTPSATHRRRSPANWNVASNAPNDWKTKHPGENKSKSNVVYSSRSAQAISNKELKRQKETDALYGDR